MLASVPGMGRTDLTDARELVGHGLSHHRDRGCTTSIVDQPIAEW
ncbi:hypothetical protein [Haliangium sp.]